MAGERRKMKFKALLATVAVMTLLAAWASGCGDNGAETVTESPHEPSGQGRKIPLSTIAQGTDSDYGRYDEMPIPSENPPECLVITESEEYRRLCSMAFPGRPVKEVDFERYVVIAAMQGIRNTSGHAISIVNAHQSGYQVKVELEVIEPEPGSMTAQVLTSPYHLVAAERAAFDPRGEIEFTFFDQEYNQLAQQPVEI